MIAKEEDLNGKKRLRGLRAFRETVADDCWEEFSHVQQARSPMPDSWTRGSVVEKKEKLQVGEGGFRGSCSNERFGFRLPRDLEERNIPLMWFPDTTTKIEKFSAGGVQSARREQLWERRITDKLDEDNGLTLS